MSRPHAPHRKTEVLDAVIAYLAPHGLAQLSMRKLAEALGTSTSVISYQFGGKEALIQEALVRAREANLSEFTRLRTAQPELTFGQGLVALWDWWMDEPARLTYSRFNIEAMLTEGVLPRTQRDDLSTFWLDYFTEWLVHDGLSPETAQIQATLALSILSGVTIDLISTGDAERLTAAVAAFASTLPSR